jgi:hypothetical protein
VEKRCIRLDTPGGEPAREEPDMAGTLEAVPSTRTVEKQREISEVDAAPELVRMAREQGLALTGPDGLLKQLTRTVIETDRAPRL